MAKDHFIAPIHSLPAEVLLCIPQYLATADTTRFRTTCKSLYALFTESDIARFQAEKLVRAPRSEDEAILKECFGPPTFFASLVIHLDRLGAPVGLKRVPRASGDGEACWGWRAIRYAACTDKAGSGWKKARQAVRMLLDAGAFVDCRDWSLDDRAFPRGFEDWDADCSYWKVSEKTAFTTYWGATPLSEAAARGNLELVAILLQAGANPNLKYNRKMEHKKIVTAQEKALYGPLADKKISTAFEEALWRGDTDMMLLLLSGGFSVEQHADRILTEIARKDDASILEHLLQFGFAPFFTSVSAKQLGMNGAVKCFEHLIDSNIPTIDMQFLLTAAAHDEQGKLPEIEAGAEIRMGHCTGRHSPDPVGR
ncbi:uncharacterized protein SPPG_04922 [Spizellomyces punctatus DAOM BR117]|uniref:F-box domain-containing protein n=1 Tax=Spizellomyces punctatus (strain DAOM BR117) TaxID=645134 RepID=A0A0L0HEK9_SPIPD|nr:uncharacterized protein SPPG_04922 [Spizellomyces punctatus DAOM BR117]KNC99532.1 hypothetical protein SPPG_04922 [Spizellomyces punctatus DAOM BR117]|eukprot:XP_016607572.1 hypothetical protein SPPG_04922 [Spizellomyces punctatus DAOM BR117]